MVTDTTKSCLLSPASTSPAADNQMNSALLSTSQACLKKEGYVSKMMIYDIDDDGEAELITGTLKGVLSVYKIDNNSSALEPSSAISTCLNLGTITSIAVSESKLVILCAEGQCYLFDIPLTLSSFLLSPSLCVRVPLNSTCVVSCGDESIVLATSDHCMSIVHYNRISIEYHLIVGSLPSSIQQISLETNSSLMACGCSNDALLILAQQITKHSSDIVLPKTCVWNAVTGAKINVYVPENARVQHHIDEDVNNDSETQSAELLNVNVVWIESSSSNIQCLSQRYFLALSTSYGHVEVRAVTMLSGFQVQTELVWSQQYSLRIISIATTHFHRHIDDFSSSSPSLILCAENGDMLVIEGIDSNDCPVRTRLFQLGRRVSAFAISNFTHPSHCDEVYCGFATFDTYVIVGCSWLSASDEFEPDDDLIKCLCVNNHLQNVIVRLRDIGYLHHNDEMPCRRELANALQKLLQ